MEDYYGIVIKQSLKDHNSADVLDIVAHKHVGTWDFLFVRVKEQQFLETISELQVNMIDANIDCWYNHFFHDNEVVVVYQDQVFQVRMDPNTWSEVIQYGLIHGIPREQLDFNPRTIQDSYIFFGIHLN
ncbi:hypothetical protein [Paenibacillus segetis]|uniref:Group-specific protein n=1 Tax=Paenibacillus segetis TaxID=1325360 RepID=A0ABQ1YFE4_9BACL|nr:hypothetical protein [Paenibacillus segetis]GGH22560.1 hypothetical protein GCM10008013_21070 [Paenibacillus segetis]